MAVPDSSPPGGLFHGRPAYEPRTPWTPLTAIPATVAIVAISIVVSTLALGGVAGGTGRGLPASGDAAALATLAIWQTMAIALTVAASALFRGHVRDVLAMGPAPSARVYPQALLLMVALQLSVSVVQHILLHDMFADLRPMARMLADKEWLLALLVVGVGAPLSEELLFRGFLLSALARSRLGFAGAALVSTVAWTALHAGYSVWGMIEVFLIGLFFSWLLWRTGSLRVAILCHALYNSLIVIVLRHVPLPA